MTTSILPRPQGAPWLRKLAALWHQDRSQRQAERMNRAALKTLKTMDDHMLRDVGLTRTDIDRVREFPLSVRAADELIELALKPRHSW